MTASPRVRLRPATLDDADLLDAWAASPEARREFNDFGEPRGRPSREMLAEGRLLGENHGELLVERLADQRPIGSISWHAAMNGPMKSRAYHDLVVYTGLRDDRA